MFFQLGERVHEGEEGEKGEKKRREQRATPFRPVKILRWPRCFVYWSLFTRKSFTVLSHFADCRSGTNTVSLENAGHEATFTNRRSFSSAKKILKPTGRHSTAKVPLSPVDRARHVCAVPSDNSQLFLKTRSPHGRLSILSGASRLIFPVG